MPSPTQINTEKGVEIQCALPKVKTVKNPLLFLQKCTLTMPRANDTVLVNGQASIINQMAAPLGQFIVWQDFDALK